MNFSRAALLTMALVCAQAHAASYFSPMATHCRSNPDRADIPILPYYLTDVLTMGTENYQLVRDVNDSGTTVHLRKNDRFHVSVENDGQIRLEHKTRDERARTWVLHATATLVFDKSQLWLSGPAVLAGSKATVGEYFLFRRDDAGTSSGAPACEHPGVNSPYICKRFRFEYYENFGGFDSHKPVLGRNVWPGTCGRSILQTGDGDGDNGPDN